MRRVLLPLALLAALGAPVTLAQSGVLADTAGAPERPVTAAGPAGALAAGQEARSPEAVRFDSMVAARAAVIVARTDSVRQARLASEGVSEPMWFVRWAWPLLWVILALAYAVGVGVMTHRLADRRLARGNVALGAATAATRAATRAAEEARQATEALRREVGAHLQRASSVVTESERQLGTTSALIDRDDRASRFQEVFRETTHRPDPPPAPPVS